MNKERETIGSVAFSRRGNPASGKYEAAVILKAFGEIPKDPRHYRLVCVMAVGADKFRIIGLGESAAPAALHKPQAR
jgi:hypothetical protein